MTADPVVISAEESALEAHEAMLRRGIRHLPIVDEKRRVIGVLSCDDLRAALPLEAGYGVALPVAARAEANEWRVGDLMTHLPETVGPSDALATAARRMAARRIGCLPVVDRERVLVGILSETDLLRALAAKLGPADAAPEARAESEGSLLRELERERSAVAHELEVLGNRDRMRTGERREPGDFAEQATLRSDELFAESLEAMRARRLAALDRALERAASGHFGRCERCSGEIQPARLRALPGTTLCIRCARTSETPRA
jgi:CBS domain-containing protein/RNA polymerase-binding transcription factor DksA